MGSISKSHDPEGYTSVTTEGIFTSTNCCWDLNTTEGLEDGADQGGISAQHVILCTFLFAITILTILGNLVVLVAFWLEPRLTKNNIFNLYVMNLAVTDFLVGVTAMSFYTFDILLGYWPFGEILCGFWVFFDYGMTFASVFTLVAISLDRYWSVGWSLHYRQNNTKKKVLTIIAIVWLGVLVVWLGPCILDRVKWSEPGVCKWEPSKNEEFVIFVAIIGHHIPCIVLVYCYIRVAQAMKKRAKVRPGGKRAVSSTSASVTATFEDTGTVSYVENSTVNPASNTDEPSINPTGQYLVPPPPAGQKKKKTSKHSSEKNKEYKIFITLSYIIFSYLACWVPFHIVFDCSAVDAELVPEPIFTTTFWLTYFNSTLNPFLYAYSSKEFRQAFIKVIKCEHLRRKH